MAIHNKLVGTLPSMVDEDLKLISNYLILILKYGLPI